jgi:hypothetical protein
MLVSGIAPSCNSRPREKRLSPRRAPKRSLLPLSPRHTQGSPKTTPISKCLAIARCTSAPAEASPAQEYRLRLKQLPSASHKLARHLPFKSSTPASAGLLRFPCLSPRRSHWRSAFGSKNMQQHFFSFESGELQKNKKDSSSHCSSVQERLVNYGSEALDTAEHLGLILHSQKQADVLLKHFGSLTVLARASVQELLPFVPRSKALRLVSSGWVPLNEKLRPMAWLPP